MAWKTIADRTISTNFRLKLEWEETEISVSRNTSTVRARVTLYNDNNSSAIRSNSCRIALAVAGQVRESRDSINIPAGTSIEYLTFEGVTVPHDGNGYAEADIDVSFIIYLSSKIADSFGGTAVMTTISRYSVIASISSPVILDGESVFNLLIDRKDERYTHDVTLQVSTESTTIEDVGASLTFVMPVELAQLSVFQTQRSVTGHCTVVTLYDGVEMIGSEQTATFEVRLPDLKPLVDGTTVSLSPVHALTGFTSFVQGYSKIRATFAASDSAYGTGAPIVSKRMTVNGKSIAASSNVAESDVIGANGAVSVQAFATDARGSTGSGTFSVTFQPYSAPTLANTQVFRCNQQGVADQQGTYVFAKSSVIYSPVNGENGIAEMIGRRRAVGSDTWAAQWTMRPGVGAIAGGGALSPTVSYEVEIRVTDLVGNVASQIFTIPTAARTFNIMDGGMGAAFGKYANRANALDVAWDIRTDGDLYAGGDLHLTGQLSGKVGSEAYCIVGTGDEGEIHAIPADDVVSGIAAIMLNMVYPVGSIYMSMNATSPASLFGGTWERIQGQFLMAANASYPVGTTGGAAAHQLKEHKHLTPAGYASLNGNDYLTVQDIASNGTEVEASTQGIVSAAATVSMPTQTYYGNVTRVYSQGAKAMTAQDDLMMDTMPPYLAVYMWKRTA